MADAADLTNEFTEVHLERSLRAIAPVPAGEPGICENCDEQSPRLVHGRCAPCREPRRGYRA